MPSSLARGWELDLAAQPVDRVTLLVSYQWLNAKTQSGLAVRNVPQGGTYKAAAKYAFPSAVLKGLEAGANYEHINDSRVGDTNNTFRLPGYDLVGVFASYRRERWRFQVNVDNVADKWYVAGSTAQQFMRSGAPRSWHFSTGYTF